MSKRTISETELLWNFVTSSGPGGQNVNKTATKVQLRWHVVSSASLTDEEKVKLTTRLRHFLTDDGYVAINCDQTRSQSQNKDLALKRLTELVNLSLQPIKLRRPTKPSVAAKRQRLQTKKYRGQIKRNRQIKTTDLD